MFVMSDVENVSGKDVSQLLRVWHSDIHDENGFVALTEPPDEVPCKCEYPQIWIAANRRYTIRWPMTFSNASAFESVMAKKKAIIGNHAAARENLSMTGNVTADALALFLANAGTHKLTVQPLVRYSNLSRQCLPRDKSAAYATYRGTKEQVENAVYRASIGYDTHYYKPNAYRLSFAQCSESSEWCATESVYGTSVENMQLPPTTSRGTVLMSCQDADRTASDIDAGQFVNPSTAVATPMGSVAISAEKKLNLTAYTAFMKAWADDVAEFDTSGGTAGWIGRTEGNDTIGMRCSCRDPVVIRHPDGMFTVRVNLVFESETAARRIMAHKYRLLRGDDAVDDDRANKTIQMLRTYWMEGLTVQTVDLYAGTDSEMCTPASKDVKITTRTCPTAGRCDDFTQRMLHGVQSLHTYLYPHNLYSVGIVRETKALVESVWLDPATTSAHSTSISSARTLMGAANGTSVVWACNEAKTNYNQALALASK
jgi:hypothetical protein